jgi:hypothetical protein
LETAKKQSAVGLEAATDIARANAASPTLDSGVSAYFRLFFTFPYASKANFSEANLIFLGSVSVINFPLRWV